MWAASFHLGLSVTGILALYGAVLSTLTAAIQLSNHFRDRAKVVLKIRKNMRFTGGGHAYSGMIVVIVTATNVGRRPVTISGFAAALLFRNGREETDWVLFDVRPPLPFEITEGKEVSAFVNQEKVDFGSISHWYAWDSAGRHYRLTVAPWYKRWLSSYRYKHAKQPEEQARQ
jgi:hypothetical protein